jgi:hypothetical protein
MAAVYVIVVPSVVALAGFATLMRIIRRYERVEPS